MTTGCIGQAFQDGLESHESSTRSSATLFTDAEARCGLIPLRSFLRLEMSNESVDVAPKSGLVGILIRRNTSTLSSQLQLGKTGELKSADDSRGIAICKARSSIFRTQRQGLIGMGIEKGMVGLGRVVWKKIDAFRWLKARLFGSKPSLEIGEQNKLLSSAEVMDSILCWWRQLGFVMAD